MLNDHNKILQIVNDLKAILNTYIYFHCARKPYSVSMKKKLESKTNNWSEYKGKIEWHSVKENGKSNGT